MENQNFDRIFYKTCAGRRFRYGVLQGNETIVFMKCGAGGTLRGYQNKHLKMAYSLHKQYGYSVICATNPGGLVTEHPDKAVICDYAARRGFGEYSVYLVGSSDGAYQNLLLAQAWPQVKKLLAINLSAVSYADLAEKLRQLPHIEKFLVYGTEDWDFFFVPLLKAANIANLEIETVPGADHHFTNQVDIYIRLADLLRKDPY